MKKLIVYITVALFAIPAWAKENSVVVASKLKEVAVYRTQARLTHDADYSIPAGNTELVIDNISNNISITTLQVFLKGNAELISASYINNYIGVAPVSPQLKKWQDSVEVLNDKINLLNAEKQVYEEEQELLKQNRDLGNEKTTFTAAEVETLANMYRRRALELKEKVLVVVKAIKEQTEVRTRIQKQIGEMNAQKNRPTGQIVLKLYAAQPVTGAVRCAYSVTGAGWQPQYDLRSEGWGTPVTLIQKADVYQNTGIDWQGVKLTISTGNPSQDHNRPIMNPLYINYAEYRTYYYKSKSPGAEKNMALEEVEVVKEEDKNRDGAGDAEQKWEEPTLDYTEQDNTVSVAYDLKALQDIPSDGKAHTLQYNKQDIPATYIYHTVPRKDPAAFLLAKINDWGKYNLLAANANIFFEGAYVGQSYINPNVTGDTLLLSFGRDERIQVKRDKITDVSDIKWIGYSRVEKFVYEITLKNTKQQDVEIEILDQVPVSKQEDIKIEMGDTNGAQYMSEIGKLEWKTILTPSQTKKIRFTYTLKYPKNKQVFESN